MIGWRDPATTIYLVPRGEGPPEPGALWLGRRREAKSGFWWSDRMDYHDAWALPDPETGVLVLGDEFRAPRGYEEIGRHPSWQYNRLTYYAPVSLAHLWRAACWLQWRATLPAQRLGWLILWVGCRLASVPVPRGWTLGGAFVEAFHLAERRPS